MKTADFIREQHACTEGAEWALSVSKDMADVWDTMIKEGKHAWLIWTATSPGVFPSSTLRKLACRFVRETPLLDGRKVWDLLADEKIRKAVEVAERYADRKATKKKLADARNAARAADTAAAADAAANADAYTAYAAARATRAAYSAAYEAADPAVHAACDANADAYTAYAATRAAYSAAYAADFAARAAATRAAYSAAYAHAKAAQIKMIAELGNPFRKGQENE